MRVEDDYPRNQQIKSALGMQLYAEDEFKFPFGQVRAFLEYDSGEIKEVDLGRNFIVFEARLLMAELMKFNFNAGDEIVSGVTHMAVGTGGPYQVGGQVKAFDPSNPPVPGFDIYNENKPGSYDKNGDGLSDLINEIARKNVTSTYVDGTGGETKRRTNVVDFTAVFERNEANGPLTELAIFGGKNAQQKNSGTMVAVKTFPIITKTSDARLIWTWRLTF